MNTIQITADMLNKKIENKPKRFDMAINFYCCIEKNNRFYLAAYYYTPDWNLYYPFFDDKNKSPIFQQSEATTYNELINETNQILNIDLHEKLTLAHKRFFELFGCNCNVKHSNISELFELKYSKTSNVYTIYKLFNFIITNVEDLTKILNPAKVHCRLFDLDHLDEYNLISNAVCFAKIR